MNPHERIIGLYEENAGAWDRTRGRDLIEKPWLDRFAASLSKGGAILDVGCGMGEPIARYLIGLGFRVTGVDSSPSLIALCRERSPDHEWIVGDMRELDLARRFDGLIAWHSSFHLTPGDQRGLFPRFAAHLRPGGQLMFTSGEEEASASASGWASRSTIRASRPMTIERCWTPAASQSSTAARATRSAGKRRCGSLR